MRYTPEIMGYVEPCAWCGVEVATVVYERRRRGPMPRTIEADGLPHTCRVPARPDTGEHAFCAGCGGYTAGLACGECAAPLRAEEPKPAPHRQARPGMRPPKRLRLP